MLNLLALYSEEFLIGPIDELSLTSLTGYPKHRWTTVGHDAKAGLRVRHSYPKGSPGNKRDAEFVGRRRDWRGSCGQAMRVTISGEECYSVCHPIDGRIMAAELGFANNEVPTSEFGDLEGKFFHMLVNSKFQVTSMGDLSYDGASSIC